MAENKVGKKQPVDSVLTSSVTASGTATLIPTLGRRSHIKIKNVGTVEISVTTSLDDLASVGYPVAASGGEFTDNTNAQLYVISTGANSEVRIYERADRNMIFNN